MSFPRISPVLNNCALHSLTPEIVGEIKNFAANASYDNHHKANYELLKDEFAEFYGFNKASFSWKKLSNIIERYNPFDTQIILGPVLRSFMKNAMRKSDFIASLAQVDDISIEEHIQQYTETSDELNGRYRSIAPDQLAQYIGSPLGLRIEYHPQDGATRTFDIANPVATVSIYHSGDISGSSSGHWERTDNSDEFRYYDQAEDAQLTRIIPFLGQNQHLNRYGMNLLKQHLQLSAQANMENKRLTEKFSELTLTAMQVTKYISNTYSVPKALAVELLGDNLTESTLEFIDNYDFVEVPPDQIYENYIRADKSDSPKPDVNEDEAQIIEQLKSPVNLPEIYIPEPVVESDDSSSIGNSLVIEDTSESTDGESSLLLKEKLEPYKNRFDQLLLDLQIKTKELIAKGTEGNPDYNPRYREVATQARVLNHTLETKSQDFFDNPSASAFKIFKSSCIKAIEKATPEFKKNRSVWNDLNPVIKDLLGVLAALTVIPAIVVHAKSSHGYAQVFFGNPPTRSKEKLDDFAKKMKELEQDVESEISTPPMPGKH